MRVYRKHGYGDEGLDRARHRLSTERRDRVPTRMRSAVGAVLLLTSFIALALPGQPSAPLDLVILVENSTAVKNADPDRKLRDLLADFIRSATEETRIGLVAYDDLAFPIAPLTRMTSANRGELLDSLAHLEFDATTSNLSAGLERAIYEFARNGEDGAQRRIVMIHSGEIRTGDFEQDQAFRRWATDVLAKKAGQMSIPIQTLSFGRSADIELARNIADITDGRHRQASSSGALKTRFQELKSTLFGARPAEPPIDMAVAATPEAGTDADTSVAVEPVHLSSTGSAANRPERPAGWTVYDQVNRLNEAAAPGAGIVSTSLPLDPANGKASGDPGPADTSSPIGIDGEAPAEPNPLGDPLGDSGGVQGQSQVLWIVIGVLAVGLIAALAAFLFTRRRNEQLIRRTRQNDAESEVRLVDLSGISAQSVYTITGKLVRVCRTPGRNSDNVVCLTIPDDVISREHAYIEYRDGDYFVVDRDSDNGTYVNGRRIQEARKLKAGDRIRFATFEFGFEHPSGAQTEATMCASTDETVVNPVDAATAVYTEVATPSGGLTLVKGSRGRADATATTGPREDEPSNRTVVR